MLKPDKIVNVLFVADIDDDVLLLTRELQSYGFEVASRTVVTEDDLRAAWSKRHGYRTGGLRNPGSRLRGSYN